jgi:hypothetical protein
MLSSVVCALKECGICAPSLKVASPCHAFGAARHYNRLTACMHILPGACSSSDRAWALGPAQVPSVPTVFRAQHYYCSGQFLELGMSQHHL